MSICLLDTSVFCNILPVPGFNQDETRVRSELKAKIDRREDLFLPLTTVFETGNHIGQLSSGYRRRESAQKLVQAVTQAIEGEAPWRPMSIEVLEPRQVASWIAGFPDLAQQGIGFGDFTIIQEYERLARKLQGARSLYIWSLDAHLAGYSQP